MRLVIRFASYSFAIAALLSSAQAQSAPPNTKSAERWDGYYTGANMGGAFGGGDMLSIIPSGAPFREGQVYPNLAFDPAVLNAYRSLDVDFDTSFTGGFQAGYLTSSAGLVFGLEADINLLNVDESASASVTSANSGLKYNFRNEIEMDYVASLKARLGVPVGNWLLYGTAGIAVTTIDYSHQFDGTALTVNNTNFPISERASVSETKAGWTVGGGFEYLFSPSWSLRTEYSYTNFGTVTSANNRISPLGAGANPADAVCGQDTNQGGVFIAPASPFATPRQCFTHNADVVLHSVRLGLNYKFNQSDNSGGPPSEPQGSARWGGAYIGAHGGYAQHDGDWDAARVVAPPTLINSGTDFSPEGWSFGGLAGYNYQLGSLVLGVEGTYSATEDLNGEFSQIGFLPSFFNPLNSQGQQFNSDVDDIWTVAGRAGWAVGRLLIYGKGGYANGKISVSGANTDGDEFAGSKRHDGWVLGAGVEYLLTSTVVVGLEYSHIDLDEKTYSFNSSGATLRVEDVRAEVDAFGARVSYKFSGL